MVEGILLIIGIILAVVIGIPIACVVLWNFLKLFIALITDIGGLIFAFILFGIIVVVIGLIL